MLYEKLGNTGLIVSRVALGTMTFGKSDNGYIKTDNDQNTVDKMTSLALDLGINFFDTADMYANGQSEIMLGKALKNKRKDVIISTKCGFRVENAITSCGLSRHHIIQSVENSLKRLGTDYIDLFFLHKPDPITSLEETAEILNDMVKKGYIRYIGLSNFTAWQAQKMLGIQKERHLTKMACGQYYYSVIGRDLENDIIPFLEDNKMGLMVYSPLAGGFLTGKYTKENPLPKDGRRNTFSWPPIDLDFGYEVNKKLENIGKKYNATISQLAIAWLLGKNSVSSVIIGANNIIQLKENLDKYELIIEKDDKDKLDDLAEPYIPYPNILPVKFGDDPLVSKVLGI